MDNSLANSAGKPYYSANSRFDHCVGCVQARVGRVLGHQAVRGWLEQGGVSGPHKHIRSPNFFALKSFLSNQTNRVICLKMDNTTAVSYLNNMGGTHCPQLLHLAMEIWDWCEKRNLFLLAQHIPGKTNVEADTKSRVKQDLNDWMLHPKVIAPLIRHCTVDLFASRLSH